MQSKIDYSPRALKDLDEIWDYIEVELCNPIAAQNTVNGIMDKVDGIAAFPESGVKLEFENGLDSGYRYVVFKNYLAFYRLRPNNVVYVDRVIYGGEIIKNGIVDTMRNFVRMGGMRFLHMGSHFIRSAVKW